MHIPLNHVGECVVSHLTSWKPAGWLIAVEFLCHNALKTYAWPAEVRRRTELSLIATFEGLINARIRRMDYCMSISLSIALKAYTWHAEACRRVKLSLIATAEGRVDAEVRRLRYLDVSCALRRRPYTMFSTRL